MLLKIVCVRVCVCISVCTFFNRVINAGNCLFVNAKTPTKGKLGENINGKFQIRKKTKMRLRLSYCVDCGDAFLLVNSL